MAEVLLEGVRLEIISSLEHVVRIVLLETIVVQQVLILNLHVLAQLITIAPVEYRVNKIVA